MDETIQTRLRALPAVDEAVRTLEALWGEGAPRWALTRAVRAELDRLRRDLLEGRPAHVDRLPERVRVAMERLLLPSLRPLINATGVVVHTNLGRAPLGPEVMRRILDVAAGYSTLEYDLERRRRGSRHTHVAGLILELTGAEDAVVVNNNAAAVLLALAALAKGREVVVSRGELVEIGGSFRIPDVMAASGALLREVGTTNRTHARDYEQALCEATGMLLKVHRSNYAIVGFTAEVEPRELAALGRRHSVPAMYDLGSGCLTDLSIFGIQGETTVQRAVADGFDLVTFSGDKLLGGPQAGVIVGRAEWVGLLRAHPLMRALRPDKLTLAGLTATLEAYRDGQEATRVPVVRMLGTPAGELRRRALRLRGALRREPGAPFRFELQSTVGRVGGGSSPLTELPSWAVSVHHPDLGPDALEARLRAGTPPIIARIEQDTLLLDLRAVPERDIPRLAQAAAGALHSTSLE